MEELRRRKQNLFISLCQQKRHWRRYVYLWINYALYEELEAEAAERTREVYRAALDILPHKTFTFAKLWLLFAQFEIRQRNLTAARKILVRALAFSLVKSPYPVTKLGGGRGGILESPCLSVCLSVCL